MSVNLEMRKLGTITVNYSVSTTHENLGNMNTEIMQSTQGLMKQIWPYKKYLTFSLCDTQEIQESSSNQITYEPHCRTISGKHLPYHANINSLLILKMYIKLQPWLRDYKITAMITWPYTMTVIKNNESTVSFPTFTYSEVLTVTNLKG